MSMEAKGTIDKEGILNTGIAEAGTKLWITARVLKAENFIEGVFELDGEKWKLSFTRIDDNPQTNPNETGNG